MVLEPTESGLEAAAAVLGESLLVETNGMAANAP